MVWVDLGEYGGFDLPDDYASYLAQNAGPLSVAPSPVAAPYDTPADLAQEYAGFGDGSLPSGGLSAAAPVASSNLPSSRYVNLSPLPSYEVVGDTVEIDTPNGIGSVTIPKAQWDAQLAHRTAVENALGIPSRLTAGPNNSFNETTLADYMGAKLPFLPGKEYVLYDADAGRVLARGSDDQFQNFIDIYNSQIAPQGGKANWRMYSVGDDPNYMSDMSLTAEKGADGRYYTLEGGDIPDENPLGQFLAAALPMALSFIPGIGQLSTLGKIGVGAGSGALSSALQGGDILTGALTGGAGAAGGALLGPAIQSVGGLRQVATGLGAGIGTGVGSTVGSLVAGQNLGTALLGGAAAGLTAGLTTESANAGRSAAGADPTEGMTPQQVQDYYDFIADFDTAFPGNSAAPSSATWTGLGDAGTTVIANVPATSAPVFTPVVPTPSVTPSYPETVVTAQPETQAPEQPTLAVVPPPVVTTAPETVGTEDIVVEGQGPTQPPEQPTLAVVPPPVVTTAPETVGTEDIVVEGQGPTQPSENTSPIVPPVIPPTTTTTTTTNAGDATKSDLEQAAEDNGLSVSDYLQLLGLGLGLVGGATSGSNTGNAVIPGGLGGGGLSSVFGDELPTANILGLGTGGAGLGPRTAEDLAGRGLASNIDYYRYGYGPEQSFFANVPQGARNTSTAFTGYEQPFKGLENMAKGGYAVGGPGDGREDKIPAMLSDGEYVMDAETVAMLGNGSSKAGAEALDKFRVNIRKHKGKALAKGSFSVNAKKPEQYLKKGRG